MSAHDLKNSTHPIHFLYPSYQSLAQYLKHHEGYFKHALAYALPLYQAMGQQPSPCLGQNIAFKLNDFYQRADLHFTCVGDIAQLKNIKLYVQIRFSLENDFSLNHARLIRSLTLLAKINHEYIKLLAKNVIDADLIKLNYQNQPAVCVIEQQIPLDFSKNKFEKWLWLLDHFITDLLK